MIINPLTGKVEQEELGPTPVRSPSEQPLGSSPPSSRDFAMNYFQSPEGGQWSKNQAAGLVGNLMQESGDFRQDIVSGKTKGDAGKAVGVAQWHPTRQADFQAFIGKPLVGASLQDQLKFINYELTEGKEQRAGKKLRGVDHAELAARSVDKFYERSSGEHRRLREDNASGLAPTDVTDYTGPMEDDQQIAKSDQMIIDPMSGEAASGREPVTEMNPLAAGPVEKGTPEYNYLYGALDVVQGTVELARDATWGAISWPLAQIVRHGAVAGQKIQQSLGLVPSMTPKQQAAMGENVANYIQTMGGLATPKSKSGQQSLEAVGKVIEPISKVAHWTAQGINPEKHPNLHNAVATGVEFGLFAAVPKVKAGLTKIKKMREQSLELKGKEKAAADLKILEKQDALMKKMEADIASKEVNATRKIISDYQEGILKSKERTGQVEVELARQKEQRQQAADKAASFQRIKQQSVDAGKVEPKIIDPNTGIEVRPDLGSEPVSNFNYISPEQIKFEVKTAQQTIIDNYQKGVITKLQADKASQGLSRFEMRQIAEAPMHERLARTPQPLATGRDISRIIKEYSEGIIPDKRSLSEISMRAEKAGEVVKPNLGKEPVSNTPDLTPPTPGAKTTVESVPGEGLPRNEYQINPETGKLDPTFKAGERTAYKVGEGGAKLVESVPGEKSVWQIITDPLKSESGAVDLSFLDRRGKKWLKGSKVTDAKGNPQPMFHMANDTAVIAAGFDPKKSPEMGIHFGTEKQVKNMSTDTNFKNRKVGIPVILNIKNPIRLRDGGSFTPNSVVNQLVQKNLIPGLSEGSPKFEKLTGQMRAVRKKYEKSSVDVRDKITLEQNKVIREFLQDEGYDGIVYRNRGERLPAPKELKKEQENISAEYSQVSNNFSSSESLLKRYREKTLSLDEFNPESRQAFERLLDVDKRKQAVDKQWKDTTTQDSYIAFKPEQVKSVFEKDLWNNKRNNPEANLAEHNKPKEAKFMGTVLDPLKNARGSIRIPTRRKAVETKVNESQRKQIRKYGMMAEKAGKTFKEFLSDTGLTPKEIHAMEKLHKFVKEENPIASKLEPVKHSKGDMTPFELKPGEKKANIKVAKGNDTIGVGSKKIMIGESDAAAIFSSPPGRKGLGSWFKPAEFMFDKYPKLRNLLDQAREVQSTIKNELEISSKHVDGLQKEFSNKKLREELGAYWHSFSILGKDAMKQMGVEVNASPKYKELKTKLEPKFKDLFARINSQRVKLGKRPIKETGDYLSFFAKESLWTDFKNLVKGEEAKGGYSNLVLDDLATIKQRQAGAVKDSPAFAHLKRTGLRKGVKLELDPLVIYSRYLNDSLRHIHMSPINAFVKELLTAELTDFKTGKTAVFAEVRPNVATELASWNNKIAGLDNMEVPRVFQKLLNKGMNNLTVAQLFGNLRTSFIQSTALFPTAVKHGYGATAKGIAEAGINRKNVPIEKSSALNTAAWDAAVADMGNAIAGTKYQKAKLKVVEGSAWLMKNIDYFAREATFRTVYNSLEPLVKKGKMTEKEAIRRADAEVIRTQGSGDAVELAPIQRNVLGKMATQWQTFTINHMNFVAKDVLGIKNPELKPAETAKRVLRYVAGGLAINALFEQGLGIQSPMPAPVQGIIRGLEAGDSSAAILLSTMMEVGEAFPGGGSIKFGSNPLGPLVKQSDDIVKALSGTTAFNKDMITKAMMGDERAMIALADILGKTLGVPGTAQGTKFARGRRRGESIPRSLAGRIYTEPKKKSGLSSNLNSSKKSKLKSNLR